MKQKLLSLLSLFVVALCSQNLWAESVAPTLPAVNLESGGQYYLYNVEAELFLAYAKNSTSTMGVDEDPLPIEIVLNDNGAYTMRVTSITNGYIWSYDDYSRTNSSSYGANHSYSQWAIENKGSEGYLIQRSPLNKSYYKADQYLGWQGDNATSVYVNRPITDGVHWKFIPANETGNRYVAALKLCKAINMAEAFVENGWNIDYYVDLYATRATADIEEMTNAAYSLRNGLNMSRGYKAPYWNEYPILWHTPDGQFGQSYYATWALPNNSYTTGTYYHRYLEKGGQTSSLSATVNVDELSTFVYSTDGGSNYSSMKVYVDDVLVRTLTNSQLNTNPGSNTYTRFFEVLEPGTHTIRWVATNTDSTNGTASFYIRNAGVMKSPLITVSLLEPGSLGTEVLYNTDHIKNVRRLKVIGKMNDDDWSKVKMMTHLLDLDLSETVITSIPDYQFSCSADTSSVFLHALQLPEGVTSIGREAFYYSFINNLVFPSTVQQVGRSAFYGSHIEELLLPDNMTKFPGSSSSYSGEFSNMKWLKKLVCPKNLKIIPYNMFSGDGYCQEITLPENLTNVSDNAFRSCWIATFSEFPQSLTTIGTSAFWNCNGLQKLVIPKNVNSIGDNAFYACYGLTEVEVPVGVYDLSAVFRSCSKLETIRLDCPTVVSHSTYPIEADRIKDITLVVPNHMVTSYKLDPYWYGFKSIEGFSTAEIQDWTISRPLVLNRDRFEGNPNITILGSIDRFPSLKINGDAGMDINNLTFRGYNYNYYHNYPGQILSNSNSIVINGNVETNLYTYAKYWYFFSLPFDIKVSEITHSVEGVQKAVRYYDGANRALVGRTGSWKDYDEDAIIPAGTGFIMQTNVNSWNYFHALDNANKQQCVSAKEFVKKLAVNDSETASNKGWNLIGNPWQCFYNDHNLNFTGPITVWNVQNKTYTAYSIIDDDYAIRPNEAFFVQCPNAEYNTIGFPIGGRQLTDIIETQNASNRRVAESGALRQLITLTLSNGETADQTRIVLNEDAMMDYELTCDAAKMMSMDASVPQLYTLDADDTQYAINERPVHDGIVPLGFYAATEGSYTLTIDRCDVEEVYLIDYETGIVQLLTDSYYFHTPAGYDNGRFALRFNKGITTGVDSLTNDAKEVPFYNAIGQRVNRNSKGILIQGDKKVVNL